MERGCASAVIQGFPPDCLERSSLSAPEQTSVIVLTRSEHPISRRHIDSGALRVLNRLYRAGHTAYLVGGSVRDLFLERTPKDFDVVTSARPTQVRKLFRNCRLIGRRFRLAHVHFSGSEIVEVATFRCQPEADDDGDLLLRSDNRFGSPEEDAYRRDFTINGLFYNIADYSVIDYVGGVRDIEKRVIRTINDPWVRFQEDPVRMIRAIKFAAKLNFRIEKKTWKALGESSKAILKSPPPRVQEEIARLLEEGSSCRAITLLRESGLMKLIEPQMDAYLDSSKKRSEWDPDGDLFFDLLSGADRMADEGVKLSRSVLYTLWLLPFVLKENYLEGSGPDQIIRKQGELVFPSLGVSRRDVERVNQILLALRRFLATSKRAKRTAPRGLLSKSYLKEALQVFELYLEVFDEDLEQLEWWNEQKQAFDAKREPAPPNSKRGGTSERRTRRRRRFRKRKSN